MIAETHTLFFPELQATAASLDGGECQSGMKKGRPYVCHVFETYVGREISVSVGRKINEKGLLSITKIIIITEENTEYQTEVKRQFLQVSVCKNRYNKCSAI